MVVLFDKGEPTEVPLGRARDDRSMLRKVGDFIAPQATKRVDAIGKIATGRKSEVDPDVLQEVKGGLGTRQGVGAFSEVLSLGGLGKATKVPSWLNRLFKGKKALDTGQKVRRINKGLERAEFAGSGAIYEGGQAIADPDAEIDEILKRTGIGLAGGYVAGRVIPPTFRALGSLTRSGVSSVSRRVSGQIIDDGVIEATIKAYDNSFTDRTGILNKLDAVNENYGRTLGKLTDQQAFEVLAREGYVPTLRGTSDKADFSGLIDESGQKVGNYMDVVDRLAEKADSAGFKSVPLKEYNDLVRERILNSTDIDIASAKTQFKRQIEAVSNTYGESLDAKSLNQIKRSRDKAGKRGDFVYDVNRIMADVAREMLDSADANIKVVNKRIMELKRAQQIMKALQNQKIDTGYWSERFASLASTILAGVGGGAIALGSFLTGGGALVLAHIFSQFGAKFVSQLIRKSRFNPESLNAIRKVLKQDKDLLEEVLDDADPKDKLLIKKTLGATDEEMASKSDKGFIERVAETPNKKGGFFSFGGDNQQALNLAETRRQLIQRRDRLIKEGKAENSAEVRKIDTQLSDIQKQTQSLD